MVMILCHCSGLKDTNRFPDLKNAAGLHDRQDCKTARPARLLKIKFLFQMLVAGSADW
jgi:hypothetical protein